MKKGKLNYIRSLFTSFTIISSCMGGCACLSNYKYIFIVTKSTANITIK